MLSKSERQTIQEVMEACRIQEKGVHAIRTCKNDDKRFDLAVDVEEGLAISATRLECLLAQKFNPSVNKAIMTGLMKRRLECSWSSRFIDQAINTADQATTKKTSAVVALEAWIEFTRQSIFPIRIDCRPITAVINDAKDHDEMLKSIRIVRDVLDVATA